MLLTEMVRQVSEEENLIDDATEYSRVGASWATLHSYGNIELSEDCLVVWKGQTENSTGDAYYRIKVGSTYYIAGKKIGVETLDVYGIAWVGQGTHAVLVESYGSGQHKIRNFQMGKAKFTDAVGEAATLYASIITKQVASRTPFKTPMGDLKEAVFAVICWAKTPGAQTNFENIGDSLTNGVSLEVDGAQVDWTSRVQDPDSVESAGATYYGPLTVGSDHTFEIKKDNANTIVHINIIGCPWILSDVDHEPVTPVFPQGSTVYIVMEPLDSNPTKYVKIGKKRAVSFGDSTDFYSTADGIDIKPHNYAFESVDEEQIELLVKGLGGCISIIGVDVK